MKGTINANNDCFDGYMMRKMCGLFFFLSHITTIFQFFRCIFVSRFIEKRLVISYYRQKEFSMFNPSDQVVKTCLFDRRQRMQTTILQRVQQIMLPRGI